MSSSPRAARSAAASSSARGKIATNYHVIEGAREVAFEFADGETNRSNGFLAIDPSRDIAIIASPPLSRRPFTLATQTPRKGERVVAIGAPNRLSFSSSDGIVAAIRSNREFEEILGIKGWHADMTWVQTTSPISHGNSGGPLINMAGDIVGMNTIGLTDGQNLNFAVSSLDIRRRAR